MEKITTINGNRQQVVKDLPRLVMLCEHMNDVALEWIRDNTGLDFKPTTGGYEAQPLKSSQIAALFMTYNFKTQYVNNWEAENTLYLKNDHHVGFKVESICFECAEHNRINTNGLDRQSRLAC